MKVNVEAKSNVKTHQGAPAKKVSPALELTRSVCACLLWEDEFYESGVSIAERIKALVPQCEPEFVSDLAIEARTKMNLRHVPLLLVREMARYAGYKKYVARTLERVIQRADELSEYLAIYWKDGRKPISGQSKKGLAAAFTKFSSYALAKYNRDSVIKLRDVMFMVHPKPKDEEQKKVFDQLAEDTLPIPDTWEVALSGGKDKKETFTRLMMEKKLGALAFLRNLRNMHQAGVEATIVQDYMNSVGLDRVLPFRFVAASKAVPQWEDIIDQGFLRSTAQMPKLPGKTVVVVDVSGGMYGGRMSAKSEMNRAQAASSLASICRELCESSAIYATAGNDGRKIHKTALVPSRHGMALVDAIMQMSGPLGGGGIFLNQVMKFITSNEGTADRTIVITDEQDCAGSDDSPLKAVPLGTGYMINVDSFHNGIGYDKWIHFDGFSESVIQYIIESERLNVNQTQN